MEKIGDERVTVYKLLQEDFDDVLSTSDGDSFKESRKTLMTYKDFITKMSKDDSADYNLKDAGDVIMKILNEDVENPTFIATFNRFK